MAHTLQTLNARHYKIIDFCLRGWTNKQIAAHLGMTSVGVGIIVNSPNFQHELALRRSKLEDVSDSTIIHSDDAVTKAIRAGTLDAVKALVKGIDSEDERVQLKAAAEILDRGGFPKTQRVEAKTLSVVLSSKDVDRIQETFQLDED